MNLSLSESLLARGIVSADDPRRSETRFAEPCTWCRQLVATHVADKALRASREMRTVVADAITDSLVRHLDDTRCATAGHDPGDEDAEEGVARLAWRPAP